VPVILLRAPGWPTLSPVSWGAQVGTRAVLLRALVLLSSLAVLAALLPVEGPAPATALGAVLAVALTTGLLLPSARSTLPAPGSTRSPDAPRPDERCRSGVFRRSTSPDAPGRPRPRAPQPA
jgi:hypothetical protein